MATHETQFQDITKIPTTYHTEEANQALSLGWRLLRVVTKRDQQEFAEYILGWPVGAGDICYPENKHFTI